MPQQKSIPTVSVVVPVHSPDRPIRRAVASVLEHNKVGTDVIVVCHNTPSAVISEKLRDLKGDRLTILELHDGVPSPAGPLNYGVTAATADYVTVLGSDDQYEPAVFDFWRTELAESNPELLVGQFKVESLGRILAPAPRVGRFAQLEAAKDLLYFRTPPLAVLIRADIVHRVDYPGFTDGVRNGEDIAMSAFLWSVAKTISYSRCADGFCAGVSASDRVTSSPLPLPELLGPIHHTLAEPWIAMLTRQQRLALAQKLTTNHVISLIRERHRLGTYSDGDLTHYGNVLDAIEAFAPHYADRLTRQECRILTAARTSNSLMLGEALNSSSVLNRYLPQRLRYLFSTGGMLRRAIRLAFVPRFLQRPSVGRTDRTQL